MSIISPFPEDPGARVSACRYGEACSLPTEESPPVQSTPYRAEGDRFCRETHRYHFSQRGNFPFFKVEGLSQWQGHVILPSN